ncbi:hypothetical protein [Paenibacillus sp. MMS18-CY102]|uniref:hypothetical protein n=1 Tax=Paenibacillus sp. MMS18-CY102 TaxID=2682849 RepID=UPI0013658EDF|nr:hypothetical protein [Paenibacillus sp. MMS18-CY102]MWC27331.1 hypothetical protein [Paenibacillus sp. MMS18-CY102]
MFIQTNQKRFTLISLLTIAILLQLQGAASANSGDDSIATAKPIAFNQTYTGQLSNANDANFYAFVLKTDGKLNISLSNVSNKSWRFVLYNAKGVKFPWSEHTHEFASGNTESNIGLPAGKYFIKVERNGGNTSNSPFKIKLSFTSSSLFEKEANDALLSANPIAINQEYHAHLQHLEDKDYYQLSVPANGMASIVISSKANCSYLFQLYDSDGNALTRQERTRLSEKATSYTTYNLKLSAGTYYVSIVALQSSAKNEYTLQAKFQKGDFPDDDQNSTLATAASVDVNKAYTNMLQHNSDVDFFAFTLPHSGKLNLFILSSGDPIAQFQLYDRNGKPFQNALSHIGLPAGDYYVRISPFEGNFNRTAYSLQIQFQPGDHYEQESNDSVLTSTHLLTNSLYEGALQHGGDHDYYQFTLPSSAYVNLELAKETAAQHPQAHLLDIDGHSIHDGDLMKGKLRLEAGTYVLDFSPQSKYLETDFLFSENNYKFKINATSLPLTPDQVQLEFKQSRSIWPTKLPTS